MSETGNGFLWEKRLTAEQRELVGSMHKALWEAAWKNTPPQYRRPADDAECRRDTDEAVEASYFEAYKALARSAMRFDPGLKLKFSTFSYGMLGKPIRSYWKQRRNHERLVTGRSWGGHNNPASHFHFESLEARPADTAEDHERRAEAKQIVAGLMAWLAADRPDAHRAVLLTHGDAATEPMSLIEAGAVMGVQPKKVSHLAKLGLRKMRKRAEATGIQSPFL